MIKNRIESVSSKDGTIINYQVLGNGPGLVILPGTSSSSKNYLPLATHLADQYTVYVIDRRGRNGSGPQGEEYNLKKECEDAIALIEKTQSHFLFGHSYGAIIALNVACQNSLIKIALYKPPVSVNGSVPGEWLIEFEQLLKKEDYIGAQVVLIKGLQLNSLPSSQILKFFKSHLTEDELNELKKLLPTVSKEIREVINLDSKSNQYAQVTAETLLMTGSKSPDFIHLAIHTLESILPNSTTHVFLGQDHASPTRAPEPIKREIAQALKKFLT